MVSDYHTSVTITIATLCIVHTTIVLFVLSPFSLPPLSLSLSLSLSLLPAAGELDDIPEVAFYMVGAIEDVERNAEKLAALQQQ